jgi:tetratricopeptide (TPR) repeat protein
MTSAGVTRVVAACAVVVYLGALWNRFAGDDLYIIVHNPLVRDPAPPWRILAAPYWPPELFYSKLYRPLPIMTYALDRLVGAYAWFHAVNLVWHAGVSAAVAGLTARFAGTRAALIAGLLFAAHPVHVEAVANVVGRAELMSALFAILAVRLALTGGSALWATLAFAAALLSKENAAVTPALIAWGWILGIGRPDRRRLVAFVGGWAAVTVAWAAARAAVLAPFGRYFDIAPVFAGLDAIEARLTAVSAFADFARLLVAPLTLRVDYSPVERTAVTALGDPRFLLGVAIAAAWIGLLVLAWRRGRTVEAFGLGWVGIALVPVSNLVLPVGVLVAERTLYLPSAGLLVGAGALLAAIPRRRAVAVLTAVLVLAGAARSAARVPVWRDDVHVALSILEDSPNSYWGYRYYGGIMLSTRQPERALAAYGRALELYQRDAAMLVAAADAALTLGRPAAADSLLARAELYCDRCAALYRLQATAARSRGDTATAAALLARAPRDTAP